MIDYSSAARLAAAFILFALLHSLTVTDAFKEFLARRFGPVFVRAGYRFLFTSFSTAITVLLLAFIQRLPDHRLAVLPDWASPVFRLLQAVGAVILLLGARKMNLAEFLGLAQLIGYFRRGDSGGDMEGMKYNTLVTDGIYAVTRHPLYLGGMIMVTFNTALTVNNLCFAFLADLYFIFGAVLEEKRLRNRFGIDYDIYRQKTGMFLPSPGKLLTSAAGPRNRG